MEVRMVGGGRDERLEDGQGMEICQIHNGMTRRTCLGNRDLNPLGQASGLEDGRDTHCHSIGGEKETRKASGSKQGSRAGGQTD